MINVYAVFVESLTVYLRQVNMETYINIKVSMTRA